MVAVGGEWVGHSLLVFLDFGFCSLINFCLKLYRRWN